MSDRLPVTATVVLGVVTIVGFGAWFYGYGVLLEPIRADTGWSEAVLSSTYGVSSLGAGILATVVGRLLQTQGPRRLYVVGAVLVLAAYLVAASAGDAVVFAVAGVLAGSLTGALGYYAAVHTLIALLVPPERRAGAITTNTLWGAFASPVFLPLMAWSVTTLGWRPTLRLAGIAVALVFTALSLLVRDRRPTTSAAPPPLRAALAAAGRDRVVLALAATTFAGGLTSSLLVLYQVPVMVAAGLTATTAAGFAGARGLLQLAGRLPMPWLVRHVGSRPTLRASHVLLGVSCLLLPLSGRIPVAVVFAVVAGVALGAMIPVESIFTTEAVPLESLGLVLGLETLTRGIGAGLGPVVGGALTAAAGTRTPALGVAAGVAVVGALLVPALGGAQTGGRNAARRDASSSDPAR
ncbi:MAG TPA: MFS transporter [Egicoccus sp.]|nr:MFS transporter [Egicoccus sp.]HSK24291.1 MFS transporter [Egicoccus sp.]